jgi:aspartate/glutamate racemase
VGLPVLNIADAIGKAIQKKGLHTVALLRTKYTMEQPFYRKRLKKYGIEIIMQVSIHNKHTLHLTKKSIYYHLWPILI